MNKDIQALTVDDARAVKLAVAVAIGEPVRPGYNRFIDKLKTINTPYEDFDTTLDKLSRLEVGQHRLWMVKKTGESPDRMLQFEWLVNQTHIPGGRTALVHALFIKLCRLIGTPVPDDERGNETGTLTKAAIDELAASVQIAPEEPSVH